MESDFDQQLIASARQRLSAQLQPGFDELPAEAQVDIAVTLLACAGYLPDTFEPEHLELLHDAVRRAVAGLPRPANAVQR